MSATAPTDRRLIAVLDDEATIRKSMVRFLRTHGFETIDYALAHEFLRASRDERFDCAVIDCQMPELSGIQVVEQLRREGNALPVIMFSATDDSHVRRTSRALGVRVFLLKPVDARVLLTAIEAALKYGRVDCRQLASKR